MSGTPETDDIARGNHVVPTEWAQQLERERDEAREEAAHWKSGGNNMIKTTPETDAFAIKFKTLCGEKYWVPVEFARKLERERDEAREEGRRLKAILDVIKKEAQ